MKEKTAKALYALLKELYKSPAAKEFVDVYEREEREQRHEAQKRDKPKVGEVYRDVFGQRLVVTEICSMDYGNRKNVIFHNKETERKLPLEEFIRCFQKV